MHATGEQWLSEYRSERLAELERRTTLLEAELRRHRVLLGLALEVAVGKTDVSPWALLAVLCDYAGTDPARPAWVEEQERRDRLHATDKWIDTVLGR